MLLHLSRDRGGYFGRVAKSNACAGEERQKILSAAGLDDSDPVQPPASSDNGQDD